MNLRICNDYNIGVGDDQACSDSFSLPNIEKVSYELISMKYFQKISIKYRHTKRDPFTAWHEDSKLYSSKCNLKNSKRKNENHHNISGYISGKASTKEELKHKTKQNLKKLNEMGIVP